MQADNDKRHGVILLWGSFLTTWQLIPVTGRLEHELEFDIKLYIRAFYCCKYVVDTETLL